MAVTHAGQRAAPAAEPGLTAGVRARLRTAGQWLARRNRTSAAKADAAPLGPAEWVLASGSALVDVARERVASTLLASTTVRLGDQPCARVTARRQPGSGKVVWIVVLNGAAGISNPAIRARVEAAIAALQAETGIPAAGTGDLAWLSPAARLPVAMPGGHAEDATPR